MSGPKQPIKLCWEEEFIVLPDKVYVLEKPKVVLYKFDGTPLVRTIGFQKS